MGDAAATNPHAESGFVEAKVSRKLRETSVFRIDDKSALSEGYGHVILLVDVGRHRNGLHRAGLGIEKKCLTTIFGAD